MVCVAEVQGTAGGENDGATCAEDVGRACFECTLIDDGFSGVVLSRVDEKSAQASDDNVSNAADRTIQSRDRPGILCIKGGIGIQLKVNTERSSDSGRCTLVRKGRCCTIEYEGAVAYSPSPGASSRHVKLIYRKSPSLEVNGLGYPEAGRIRSAILLFPLGTPVGVHPVESLQLPVTVRVKIVGAAKEKVSMPTSDP